MVHKAINPTALSYSQVYEINQPARLVFISGQVPEDSEGNVPGSFRDQCLMAWRNVEGQLTAAGMEFHHLVKVTVYLSDRKYREENSMIRTEVLGANAPALTIIICGIYDEKWLLEIEAVAAG